MNRLIVPLGLASLLVAACFSDGGSGGGRSPHVDAGPDQTVRAGSQVILSGRNSDGRDSPILDYRWRVLEGDGIDEDDFIRDTAPNIRFRVPYIDREREWLFQLTVTDAGGRSSSDTVRIRALPANDTDGFLRHFGHNDKLTVVAAVDQALPLVADTPFTLSLQARVAYPVVSGAILPPDVTIGGDGRARRVLELQSREGTWLVTTPPVARSCTAPGNPRYVFPVPPLDIDRLPGVNEGRRDDIDYTVEAILDPGGSGVQGYLCLHKGEPQPGSDLPALAQGAGDPADPAASVQVPLDALLDENRETARAYYAALDPHGSKTTLRDWLDATGFERPAGSIRAGGDAVRARYINAFDLGFGRDMYMRQDPVTGYVYSYVINYPNIDSLLAGINTIATVAMEYAPGPNGGDPFTQFYTFVLDPDSGRHQRVLSMDFDGRGDKYAPGVCMTCHGGIPQRAGEFPRLNGDLFYPDGGNVGARFLPWDVDTFYYSDAQFEHRSHGLPAMPGLERHRQEDAFKAFNSMVLDTAPPPAMRELIEGWYGGEDLPRETFDGDFVPPGWDGHEPLYRRVIGPSCRACHTAHGVGSPVPDFADFAGFDGLRDTIRRYVFEDALMPFARMTKDNFWTVGAPTGARLLADELELILGEPWVGRPKTTLRILEGASVTPDGDHLADGQPIMATAGNAMFTDSFHWTLREEPGGLPVADAGLVGADSRTTGFLPPLPGQYTLEVTLGNAWSSVTTTESLQLTVPRLQPTANTISRNVVVGNSLRFTVDDLGTAGNAPTDIVLTAGPSLGSATVSDDGGVLTYNAPRGILSSPASDQLAYRLEDATGDTASALISITIVDSEVLLATDDSLSVDAEQGVDIPVLLGGPGNVNADGLGVEASAQVVAVGTPDNGGTAEILPDQQTVRYSPRAYAAGSAGSSFTPAFVGTETFDYTIEDDSGARSTATVTVTVRPRADFDLVYSQVLSAQFRCIDCHHTSDNYLGSGQGAGFQSFDTIAQAYSALVLDTSYWQANRSPTYPSAGAWRINCENADHSVLLLHPSSGRHTGGSFAASPDERQIITDWLKEGARYTDGTPAPRCWP